MPAYSTDLKERLVRAALPAALLTGLHAHRAGVLQAQGYPARARRSHRATLEQAAGGGVRGDHLR